MSKLLLHILILIVIFILSIVTLILAFLDKSLIPILSGLGCVTCLSLQGYTFYKLDEYESEKE